MKNLKVSLMVMCFLTFLAHCGSSSSTDGTDNDTDDSEPISEVDTENLADHVSGSASALLLSVDTGEAESVTMPRTTYSPDSDWDTYTGEDNITYLAEIFGSDLSGPVTQVRVLLDQFSNTLDEIASLDPDFTCESAGELTDSDTVEIAFHGEIDNGASANRNFDCVDQSEEEARLYGEDADGVVRIVHMSDATTTNTEEVETRGDTESLRQVVYATYAETSEDGATVSYLDLQYAQATVYVGSDDTFDTHDDVSFRSRSRIIGRVAFDADGNPELGSGDFFVTKYDGGVNEDDSTYTIITQTRGRGSYGSGDAALFSIDSTASPFAEIPGTFCLATTTTGETVPDATDSGSCTSLESDFAWGEADFPFTLDPNINATFDDNDFFEGDDTDLITNSGSNFVIPTY